MTVYETFDIFWQQFTNQRVNNHGFYDWHVVKIVHTSDTDYDLQRQQGTDELGFQPLIITEANPLLHQTRQTLVKHVSSSITESFKAYCRNHFYDGFKARTGSFRPDTFHAFAEYEDWDSFYNSWLERDGQTVFHRNIPLLIDHMPQLEYWTRKQTSQEILPYQRLLVTTFFVSENKFFDFFIKNIDDAAAHKITQLTQSRLGINLDLLFTQNTPTHARA